MTIKLILLFSICSISIHAQQYGVSVTPEKALDASEVSAEFVDQDPKKVKIKGTVQQVCQVKGCWLTMEVGHDTSMRVTFKDYGFFVPTDSDGKTAVIEGELTKETISVATLKHFAKDAGKSEQEIAAITEPVQELVLVADGVLIIDY